MDRKQDFNEVIKALANEIAKALQQSENSSDDAVNRLLGLTDEYEVEFTPEQEDEAYEEALEFFDSIDTLSNQIFALDKENGEWRVTVLLPTGMVAYCIAEDPFAATEGALIIFARTLKDLMDNKRKKRRK